MLSALNLALPLISKLNCNDFITGVKSFNDILTLSLLIFSTFNSTEGLLTLLLSAELFFEYANTLIKSANIIAKDIIFLF